MEDKIKEQIKSLRKELSEKREKTDSLPELLNREIDRAFQKDFWEFSAKELDSEMAHLLTLLNQDIDPRPSAESLTSHRKILGKPIILIKRTLLKISQLYSNLLLDKQRSFNQQQVAQQLASFIRFRKIESSMKNIEEKIQDVEENHQIIIDQLNKIETDLKTLNKK